MKRKNNALWDNDKQERDINTRVFCFVMFNLFFFFLFLQIKWMNRKKGRHICFFTEAG